MNGWVTIAGGVLGGGSVWLLLWVLSGKAGRSYPVTVLSPVRQEGVEECIAAWAAQYGYRLQADTGNGEIRYLKGRGWLTSATELVWQPITERLLIREEVNFLVARRAFAIDAPVFLGKPVRANKIKKINILLKELQLPPLQIK